MNEYGITPMAVPVLTKAIGTIQRVVNPTLKTDSTIQYCSKTWAWTTDYYNRIDGGEELDEVESVEDLGDVLDRRSKIEPDTREISTAIVSEKSVRGFETFTTKDPLTPGLCVTHALGNGKYEVVNLEAISLDTLKSVIGGGLGLNENPSRADMFHMPIYKWVDAITKCVVGAQYSGENLA